MNKSENVKRIRRNMAESMRNRNRVDDDSDLEDIVLKRMAVDKQEFVLMAKKIKRWVKNEGDRELLLSLIKNMDAPFTIDIEQGIREKRSTDQNRLQRLWIKEAEEQGDMTSEEYRAYCKLHFGVPLLRNENETFAELYDEKVRDRVPPFSYEQKLEFMAIPWDMHVTRLMTVKQHDKYLNKMHDHFTSLGMILTIPNDIDWVQGRDY